MTLYARSDLAYVNVPTSSGGCGEPHRRPVENGAPAKLWPLNCPGQCEDFLRKQDINGHQWSATMSEIPETHDEKISREDFDKRGAKDRDYVQLLIMAKMANVELPESMKQPLLTAAEIPSINGTMECPAGHPGKPGAKFCAECGQPMQQPVNALPAAPVLCSEGHANAASARFCATCGTSMETAQDEDEGDDAGEADLSRLHWKSLEKLCKDQGLDPTGSKAELVARLQAVSVAA